MEKSRKKGCKDQKNNRVNKSNSVLSNKSQSQTQCSNFDQSCEITTERNGAKLVHVTDADEDTTVSSGSRQNSNITPQEKSRVVYVASACHTCKAVADVGKGIKLLSCAGCRMLNYCSREHQIEDWKNHKSLCNQIQRILKAEQKTYLFDCTNVRTESEWLQIRYSYMKLLSDQLGRELEAYEKEMFLFPLYFCFACNQTKLVLCEICHHHHHSVPSSKSEEQWCQELGVWMSIVCWESCHGLTKPLCDQNEAGYPHSINDLATDFPDDIQQYFSLQKIHHDLPREVWTATIADIATVPLTIIWTLIQFAPHLTKLDSLTIHLIGAEMDFEGCCPRKWEFCFIHNLSALSTLHLVLIGPELVAGTSTPSLCTNCKAEGRQMTITNKPGIFYHEYKKHKTYVKPNIICAFNCGIYRKTGYNGKDTWAPTIPLLANTDLLIGTAYTDTEIAQDTHRILSECKDRLSVHLWPALKPSNYISWCLSIVCKCCYPLIHHPPVMILDTPYFCGTSNETLLEISIAVNAKMNFPVLI